MNKKKENGNYGDKLLLNSRIRLGFKLFYPKDKRCTL